MATTCRFSVFRYDSSSSEGPRFQEYEIPYSQGLTVLGGLLYIQQRVDGSLAFRYSCRAGVCGSCAMHINGRYRLACETQVADCNMQVTVRPLGHLPIIKDLIVDMTRFWKHYRAIKPYLIPGSPPPEREYIQTPDERACLDGIIDCILCGACYGACTTTAADPEFLGPAALAKANRFVLDSRDAATEERLELVSGEHGAWRCHQIFSCQRVCPKDINPPGAISDLKRAAVRHRLGCRPRAR